MKASEKILFTVMLILIFLAFFGIVAPRFIRSPDKIEIRPNMPIIEAAIGAYKINTGEYPKTLNDLLICPRGFEDKWLGPYLKERQLIDPWGFEYIYEPNSISPTGYNLISYGRDGKPGGEGYNADQHN